MPAWRRCTKGWAVLGGRGRFLAFQSPPTSLRRIQRKAEVGRWGRRGVSGREKGREEKKRKRGDVGQKIDLSPDHPPFLCVSARWAELTSGAPQWPAGAREGPRCTACASLGVGLSPRTQCFPLLGQRHPGERSNVLAWILGSGFVGASFGEPNFTFGKRWPFRRREPRPCLDPSARK